ncbi:hypothetical protein [Gallaecimonas sp. GXIMD4217]|uniref:hypothetical protein n=1 Tax=Gallaecimonas sp. GXIMD4217 TaxID=3131927 RepID=UPI00311B00D1
MHHPESRRTMSIRTQHLQVSALKSRVRDYPLLSAEQVVARLKGRATMGAEALCQQLAEGGFLLEIAWGGELRYPAFMVAEGEVFEEMPTLLERLGQELEADVEHYLWLTEQHPELEAVPADLLTSREGRLILLAFLQD